MLDVAKPLAKKALGVLAILALIGLVALLAHWLLKLDLGSWTSKALREATIMDLLWVAFIHVLISKIWRGKE